jgi:hypothetical protein
VALFAVFAVIAFAGSGSVAQQPPPVVATAEQSPAVKKVVDLAREGGMRTMAYLEIDERRSGAPAEVMLTIIAQQRGSLQLLDYPGGPKFNDIFNALANEASKGGWGRIVVVVDGATVDVRRDPWQGDIAGAPARSGVEIDRVFPGHAKP